MVKGITDEESLNNYDCNAPGENFHGCVYRLGLIYLDQRKLPIRNTLVTLVLQILCLLILRLSGTTVQFKFRNLCLVLHVV